MGGWGGVWGEGEEEEGLKNHHIQAEDGIRDMKRSRGLGDVYKRQVRACVCLCACVCVSVCLSNS